MTGSSVRVAIERVSHRYSGLDVLDDVSLVAEPGRVLALVGPSGCGKSTLLGIALGLIRPTAGQVSVSGHVAPDCLNVMTPVLQDFALLPWARVAENVALVLERLPERQRAERVREMLALTGLGRFAAAWPKELSGGMRQRVGIARALAVRPACLLMDEPLSALDAQTRALLLDEFAGLIERAGTTTIYVTHNLGEAVRLGHRIAVLSRRPGRVREVIEIERPLAGRSEDDPALRRIERQLWALIRDDAAASARELIDG